MVLEIRLSNFSSINEEVILDLRAGNIKSAKARELPNNVFPFDEIKVLKSVAIYGANASGKSNIIETIRFCNSMIFNSHNHNENAVFKFKPFKFGSYSKKASTYFIRFAMDDIEYEYSYSLTRSKIISESLYFYPKGRITKIFERDESKAGSKRNKYSFGTSVVKRPFDVAESTSEKTLFISRASQMDREIPKKIFSYFHQRFILKDSNYSFSNFQSLLESKKEQLLHALQMADSDIVDFKPIYRKGKGKQLKADLRTNQAFIEETESDELQIRTYHKHSPGIAFDFFTEESGGTKKLFWMMMTILDVISNSKTLLIDEIESSLHPKIVEYIIQLFHASKKAQLIFSTHNTNLLDLNRFRKDQIWFVNKKDDGGTDLYSLYDYSDFRDTMNLEKAYLQGRFDSIPIVDDSEASIESLIDE